MAKYNIERNRKEEALENIPNNIKRDLAKNKARLFIINATALAHEIGLGQRFMDLYQNK